MRDDSPVWIAFRSMLAVKYVFLTLVMVFGASAFIAVALAPAGWFLVGWVASAVLLLLVFGTGLFVLRLLRARRYGNQPPQTPVSAISVVLGLGGLIAGIGGLCICLPELMRGDDLRIWLVGTAMCIAALGVVLRDAVHYVTEP